MRCLILAGGFGTRMGQLTRETAKPLLPLGGKMVIDYIVDDIPEGIEITVSTNQKYATDFNNWGENLKRDVKILVEESNSHETKLGACSAVDMFIKKQSAGDDLLVVAGDNLFTAGISGFIEDYNGFNPLVALYNVRSVAEARRFGVVTMSGGSIIRLDEKPVRPASTLIATACYILPPSSFQHLSDYCSEKRDNLGGFINYLASKEEVHPFFVSGKWYDVGSVEVYETLTHLYTPRKSMESVCE